MVLDSLEISLCQMQAHLYELSAEKRYDSEAFIKSFMNDDIAEDLDKTFHHTQWAGGRISDFAFEGRKSGSCKAVVLLDTKTLFGAAFFTVIGISTPANPVRQFTSKLR